MPSLIHRSLQSSGRDLVAVPLVRQLVDEHVARERVVGSSPSVTIDWVSIALLRRYDEHARRVGNG